MISMEDEDFRTFVFSSQDFGGFTILVDLSQCSSIGVIEGICTSSLFQVLVDYNFDVLLERAQKRVFHIHELTLEQIREMEPSKKIYVCDTCYKK